MMNIGKKKKKKKKNTKLRAIELGAITMCQTQQAVTTNLSFNIDKSLEGRGGHCTSHFRHYFVIYFGHVKEGVIHVTQPAE